ncbi:response regulator [Ferrovibrio sp.]|uniref:response regulator transcription factor n=1 Tax=Ferrovibrio sp. TaxID=1917215 RepID=UPI003120288C
MTDRATIYIVDDDEVVRDSLKALLEVRQYAVQDFESGREFLAADPDLAGSCLILDIHMPGMTGLELLRAIRQRHPAAAAILVTGRRDAPIQAAAEELGAVALLDKPLAHGALFGAIEQALEQPRAGS